MKVTASTIARTVILLLALINQILTSTGHPIIQIADEDITQLISLAFTTVTALIAWWKNNSFTQAALKGDEVMHQIKQQ